MKRGIDKANYRYVEMPLAWWYLFFLVSVKRDKNDPVRKEWLDKYYAAKKSGETIAIHPV